MKNIRNSFIVGLCLLSFGIATSLWLNAEEATADAAAGDKWEQIKKNQQELNQNLDAIEQNLQFIKARSMSGGRSS